MLPILPAGIVPVKSTYDRALRAIGEASHLLADDPNQIALDLHLERWGTRSDGAAVGRPFRTSAHRHANLLAHRRRLVTIRCLNGCRSKPIRMFGAISLEKMGRNRPSYSCDFGQMADVGSDVLRQASDESEDG